MAQYLYLIPLLPLLAFVINLLFGRVIGKNAHWIATPAVFAPFLLSLLVLWQWRLLGSRSFLTVTGRGYQPRVTSLGRWRFLTLALALAFIFVTVVLPVGQLVLGSFFKFFGFYRQQERDARGKKSGDQIFMVRIKNPAGGELGPRQWAALDEAADRFGDGTLRITSRQGIQYHYVYGPKLAPLVRHLKVPFVNRAERRRLFRVGRLVSHYIGRHQVRRERIFLNVPPAIVRTLQLKPATCGAGAEVVSFG